jgi:hypothetical protein
MTGGWPLGRRERMSIGELTYEEVRKEAVAFLSGNKGRTE